MGNQCGNCKCSDKKTQKDEFTTDTSLHSNNLNNIKSKNGKFETTGLKVP